MFTITAKNEPVRIDTVSFHTDLSTAVTAIVYTKPGNYIGFESTPSAWRKVAEATTIGAGNGKPTMIPRQDFESFTLGIGETVALYVTMTTPNIRYTRTEILTGDPVVSDEYLTVSAGDGVADYPFATEFFLYQPRIFNGMVHYAVDSECFAMAPVGYAFQVQHSQSVPQSQVVGQMASIMEQILLGQVQTVPSLKAFVDQHDLSIQGVDVTPMQTPCTPIRSGLACTALETNAIMRKANTLPIGEVKYEMLAINENVSEEVNRVFQALYVGNKPVSNSLEVELRSSQMVEEMTDLQKEAFANATLAFLRGPLEAQNVSLLCVRVNGQSVRSLDNEANRRLQRSDDDAVQSTASSSLSVSTTITGEYRPPPYVDFNEAVSDAIDGDPTGYEGEIKRSDEYFEVYDAVEKLKAKEDNVAVGADKVLAPPEASAKPFSQTPGFIILIAVLIGCVLLCGIYFLGRSRQKNRNNEELLDSGDYLGKYDDNRGFLQKFLPRRGQKSIEEAEVGWADMPYAEVTYAKPYTDQKPGVVADNVNDEYGSAIVADVTTANGIDDKPKPPTPASLPGVNRMDQSYDDYRDNPRREYA